MRVKVTKTGGGAAVLALARALEVSANEARVLMAQPRVLPAELTPSAAAALCEALEAAGAHAQPIEVPPSHQRCQQHPRLTADLACQTCRRSVCVVCLGAEGRAECESCAAVTASRTRWKWRRVGVLLVVFTLLSAALVVRDQRRTRRVTWQRPVQVSVTLVSEAPLPPQVEEAWRDGVADLQVWFEREAQRLAAPLERPFIVELRTSQQRSPLPAPFRPTGDWFDDLKGGWVFRRELLALAGPGGDLHLVVALGSASANAAGIVEGIAEAGGEVGLVSASVQDTELTLELLATAHETLHLVGALDAYTASGHARVPEGLAEPQRVPPFPQRFAEVMAGELPESGDTGRLPRTLDEVRIGPTTARAIAWEVPKDPEATAR